MVPLGYTLRVALRRVKLWMLLLVALLNSGGMGYWVCHDQVRSGCFWLRACSEDVSFVLQADAAPQPTTTPTLGVRACDCEFVALTAPVPTPNSLDALLHRGEGAPLRESQSLLPTLSLYLCVPRSKSPPTRDARYDYPPFRAPPTL